MSRQVKQSDSHSLVPRRSQLPLWQAGGILDKALLLIAAVVEYLFVMHIGVVIGWLIGLCAGNIYFDQFSPEDCSKAFVLTKQGVIPYAFTKNGAITGILVSVIALAVINKRLFLREVTSFYAKGVTSSDEVARRLGYSVWRVERTMRRFNSNIERAKMCIAHSKNESGITILSQRIAGLRVQRFQRKFQNRIGGVKCQSTFV